MSARPAVPEGYTLPEVWRPEEQGEGVWAAMNRPTAGARSEGELPKGVHPYQLHSLGTPNGQKVTILLEELGVEYDAWRVPIMEQKQFTTGFVALNPNSKIPAMYDYSVKDAEGAPARLFESGSILLYLADKHERFIPQDPVRRAECINWLMWQMGTAPYIGGGFSYFFKKAPVLLKHAVDRFAMETKRILDVLDKHLADGRPYVVGDEYTIADMAIYPWVVVIEVLYGAGTFLGLDGYAHVGAWRRRLAARKAVQRGMRVNGWLEGAVPERHSKDAFAPEDY